MIIGRQIDFASGSHTLFTGPRRGPMGNVRWQNMTYKSSKPHAPVSHSLRSPVRAVGTSSMNWLKTKAQDETDGVVGDLPCVHDFGWRHPWAQSKGKAETGERFKLQDSRLLYYFIREIKTWLNIDPNTKRFKRTLIYFNTQTFEEIPFIKPLEL